MPQNPFNVEDVIDPDGDEVATFAASVRLTGSASDRNAGSWADLAGRDCSSIAGGWSSRWNSQGTDWQVGHSTVRLDDDTLRVFVLFDWDGGTKQGLLEAHHDGAHRLVGRYVNLSEPGTTRPWVGLVVDTTRIDGEHPGGRLDFRR